MKTEAWSEKVVSKCIKVSVDNVGQFYDPPKITVYGVDGTREEVTIQGTAREIFICWQERDT